MLDKRLEGRYVNFELSIGECSGYSKGLFREGRNFRKVWHNRVFQRLLQEKSNRQLADKTKIREQSRRFGR